MKKIIIFLVSFAIIAIGITTGLINYTKSVNNILLDMSGEKAVNNPVGKNNETVPEEKTIDLYGTYNQNDLKIDNISYTFEDKNITLNIPQISGLKDKKIEDKINLSIKERIIDKVLYLIEEKGMTGLNFYYDDYNEANFSNVISFNYSIYGKINNEGHSEKIAFNYELVHGEELKLEDILKKGEDLNTILRMALYKHLEELSRSEGFGYGDPYYDEKKGTWFAEYTWYDDKTNKEKTEIREYIPELSEYEIEKELRKFAKDGYKNFYFSPFYLIFNFEKFESRLMLKDIANKVVIYDKYLTKESIYESDDIGIKNILTCSAESNFNKFKETKFESDNFFYDINASMEEGYLLESQEYPAQKYLIGKVNEEMNIVKEKIQEYKKIANENKDKAYLLFVLVEANYGTDYKNSKIIYNNLLSVGVETKLITCNINAQKEVMNRIFEDSFRYYNLIFYYNPYNMISKYTVLGDKYKEEEFLNLVKEQGVTYEEQVIDKHIYDVITGKEVKSINEVFKEDVDYKQVIKNSSRFSISDNAKFEFDVNGITILDNDMSEWRRVVDYSDMKEYLNLKELKSELLPSAERQIEKSELDGLSREELNKAYNEIYARHGHDFKNNELKYYFNLWDWYQPVQGKTVSLEELSEIEKYNAELIKNYISEKDMAMQNNPET